MTDVISEKNWYETINFANGITLIHEPWITPYFRCNMWLVRGRDRDLLVDTGLGAFPLRRNVPELSDRDIICLSSHTHFDHIGMTAEFDTRLVHQLEAGILRQPSHDKTLFQDYADGSHDDEMFIAPPENWDARNYQIAPAPASGLVEHGDRIDLGDRVLEVIHTPGHSPGHVSLWEEATATLIAQDVIYDGPLVTDCQGANMADYMMTMRHLAGLKPRIVHGGHFPSFGATRFHQLISGFLNTSA